MMNNRDDAVTRTEPAWRRWLMQLSIAMNVVFGVAAIWQGNLWGLFNVAVAWVCIGTYAVLYPR